MKILIFSLVIAFSLLINFNSASAEFIKDDLPFSGNSNNNLSVNDDTEVDLSHGNKSDKDIFGDEQTFPFVAGLGKNAAH
tara:strand:+ start:149 stop:388 length:240 start_codon:yes stop_codon:yes gene_type:complete